MYTKPEKAVPPAAAAKPKIIALVAPGPVAALFERAAKAAGLAWTVVGPHTAAAAVSSSRGPVAVLGMGLLGDAALATAAADGSVMAVATVNGVLTAGSIELLGEWPELPVLAMVDPADRLALRWSVDAFLASRHNDSELFVGSIEDRADAVMAWLRDRMTTSAIVDEVVVTTDDGWEIHGTRSMPRADHPVPGVVLLHTGRSDRAVYTRLEQLIAAAGMAVLNIDWRGRGRSTGKGSYLDLTPEAFADAWRDALAALEHLASLPGVDAKRLATVGAVQGGEIAARAAQRDRRVKAVALLTGYEPADDAERAHLVSGAVELFLIASTGHGPRAEALRTIYAESPGRRARFREYPGALLGYQLFEVDPTIEPAIVDWLAEVLEA